MTRYFFNLHMGGTNLADLEGVELRSVDSATASDWGWFIRAGLTGDDEVALAGARFEVTDELGRSVAIVSI